MSHDLGVTDQDPRISRVPAMRSGDVASQLLHQPFRHLLSLRLRAVVIFLLLVQSRVEIEISHRIRLRVPYEQFRMDSVSRLNKSK